VGEFPSVASRERWTERRERPWDGPARTSLGAVLLLQSARRVTVRVATPSSVPAATDPGVVALPFSAARGLLRWRVHHSLARACVQRPAAAHSPSLLRRR